MRALCTVEEQSTRHKIIGINSVLTNFIVPSNCVTLHSKGILFSYSVATANLDLSKNMLLLKNLQFVPNHCETLSQRGTHYS